MTRGMMRLHPHWGCMALDIPVKFQAAWSPNLPPASELGTVLSKAGIPWARDGSEAVMSWAQHAQAELAMKLESRGVALPPGVAGLSKDLWGIGWAFAGAETRQQMIDAAMGAGKQIAGILAGSQAVSSMPVVGWIIGAITTLAEVGVTIWKTEKQRIDDAQAKVIPIRYDESADKYSGSEFLRYASLDDWTFAFQPFQTGPTKSYKLIDSPSSANRVWSLSGAKTGLGEVPGLGRIYRAWAFDTTLSTKALRTRNGGLSYESFSAYRPVTVGVAAQLWSRVETDGIQAFAVDRSKLEKEWTLWDEQLIPLAFGGVSGEDTGYRARAVVSPVEVLMDLPPVQYRPDLEAEFPGLGVVRVPTVGSYVRWQLARLRQRQMALLDTIVCAYVAKNAPALRDTELWDRWDERRKQLLQHQAVHRVDPAAVPDEDYRLDIVAAQKQVKFPIKEGVGEAPDRLPGALPLPIPKVFPAWGKTGSDGGLLLLGAVALGLGYFALSR